MGQIKKVPMRQCLGCREMKSKKELIRVIKDNQNNFSVDVTGKKNGRGAYICNSMECLEKAIKTKSFERSFKMSIPEEIYAELRKELGEANA